MIKRLIIIFLAILYLGTSAFAGVSCRLWMGTAAATHSMISGHQGCMGMPTNKMPEKNCCKQVCQELKATKTMAFALDHKAPLSLPAVLPRIRFLQYSLSFPAGDKIAINQPPSVGRSVPVFLRLRNFRI